MPTLYVENVPEDLCKALKARAKQHQRSLAAEVISVLADQVPTAQELRHRKKFFDMSRRLTAERSPLGSFPSTEEMLREDRSR
ncbi:MAG: hypothetical protein JO033_09810 [Acidobacteriaceae bacterium]|nr:hypothetical protein [Acidobacteriaceae bacterium]MBV9500006.1 hypothetical protein [Acidobacteriaceae bacterium]